MSKKIWMSLPVTLMCSLVIAQGSTTTAPAPTSSPATPTAAPAATSTTAVKKEEEKKVGYSLAISIGYDLQAKPDATKGTRSESLSYTFIPGMSYGDYSASAVIPFEQDLKDTSGGAVYYDPTYTLSRASIPASDYFKIGPSMSLVLPMTDNSKNNNQLLYIVGGALSFSLQTKKLGLDNWKTSYSVQYTRNFTQFATSADGEVLTLQRIRQRFNVGYQFTEKFSLATRFEFDSNYSAEGVVRNKFSHFQSFGYDINDTVSVSLGHSSGGDLLKKGTYENNLKFFDDVASTYSAGLDISL
jgi:hypothetical protein